MGLDFIPSASGQVSKVKSFNHGTFVKNIFILHSFLTRRLLDMAEDCHVSDYYLPTSSLTPRNASEKKLLFASGPPQTKHTDLCNEDSRGNKSRHHVETAGNARKPGTATRKCRGKKSHREAATICSTRAPMQAGLRRSGPGRVRNFVCTTPADVLF